MEVSMALRTPRRLSHVTVHTTFQGDGKQC
ncbi:putative protein OS=Streptomyces griseomycini OX=66895 GN=FHS37_003875 PE=4 SV=1 [Streptomyces griseomycini]|uniref:Uncharacterized protein n=1 Tax=Streptomyces griseomycini TaxID=66895 RepID=A0A7W7M0H4_9ACTN|nr:hypothetical protein [Streptomyces griseomycini]